MKIDKDKIPKGSSFALKSSILLKAFEKSKITTETHLCFINNNKILFDAHYWLPNKNVDYFRFYIRTGVVPSNRRKEAKEFLEKEVIPEFIEWAVNLINLPGNSTKLLTEKYFIRNFT